MLLIVRHGETAPNVEGLLLGRADPPLTPVGMAQSRAVAAVLPTPSLVVASPLRRARETAACFAAPTDIDDRWIEQDFGELDGSPAAALTGQSFDLWRTDPTWSPPGGESVAAVGKRVRAACESLVDRARSGVVVVVTHVSPIRAAVGWALGLPDVAVWRMYVEDASVSRIDLDTAGPVLRWFNRAPAV